MTGKERILKMLRGETPDAVPTFEWFIDASVGRAMTGSDDPLDIVEELDLDGVNVRADYRSESIDERTLVDEWQIRRQLTGDCIPALLASPIEDITRHADYEFPDPEAPHRLATVEKASERFGDRRAVILNLRDGFSDMRDLLGYENALVSLLTEPEAFGELLGRVVRYNLALATVAQKRYGTQIVATTDDVANAEGLLMRAQTYCDVLGPKFREVFAGYRELGYLCIKHCDGNIDAVLDFWIDCGIDCLDPIDPGAGYTIAGMRERYGDRLCLKGNVDCTGALCDGTPDEVAEETRQCLRDGGADGRLILSSSNTIHRGVKPDNYRAMLDALRQYGAYPDVA